MRRRSIRRLAATLTLGVAGTAAIAANPKPPETKSARPPVVVAPLSADVIADAVRSEQDAVLRRLDICDKLRKLGESTGNPALIQQAEDLEKQATTLYSARVARLGVKGGPKASEDDVAIHAPAVVPPAPVAATGGR
jgi:hypothetical protein